MQRGMNRRYRAEEGVVVLEEAGEYVFVTLRGLLGGDVFHERRIGCLEVGGNAFGQ